MRARSFGVRSIFTVVYAFQIVVTFFLCLVGVILILSLIPLHLPSHKDRLSDLQDKSCLSPNSSPLHLISRLFLYVEQRLCWFIVIWTIERRSPAMIERRNRSIRATGQRLKQRYGGFRHSDPLHAHVSTDAANLQFKIQTFAFSPYFQRSLAIESDWTESRTFVQRQRLFGSDRCDDLSHQLSAGVSTENHRPSESMEPHQTPDRT